MANDPRSPEIRPAYVFLFFALLAVVLTAPVSLAPHRLAMDDGDALIGSWIVAWDAHQLVRDPLRLFDANAYHPYETSLAFSEHLIVPALLAAPVFLATGNALLAHNLAVLLTLSLSAWAMYLLVKEVLGRSDAALVAGTIYVFHTYGIHETVRIQIVSVQWWPLALLYLHRHFQGRERRRRDAALFAFFFLLHGLSCTYYLFYFSLALALFVPVYVWKSHDGWRKLRELVVPGLLAAGALFTFALPYLRVVSRFGFHRELAEGLDAAQYVRPFEGSFLASLAAPLVEPGVVPHFLGYVPLLLALVGTFAALRGGGWSRRFVRLCLVTALLGLVLSLGPTVRVGGAELGPGIYGLLHEHVPGFGFLRSPDRMSVLARFGLAVVGGFGAGWLFAHLSRRPASVLLIAILVLLPLEHLRALPWREIPTGKRAPDVYRWLGSLDGEGAVVELPPYPREQLRLHSLYMFYSTYHWKPIVFGKASYYPPLVGYLAWELRDFPSREDVALLRRVGVSRVVVRPGMWEGRERDEKLASLRRLRSELVPEGRFPPLDGADHARYRLGDERVFRLSPGAPPIESPPLCVPADEIEPAGWRIEAEGDAPVEWAVDRDRRTAWSSDGQLPGIALDVDLGREEIVAAVRVAIAHPYDQFPRDLTLKTRSEGGARFEPVAHRDDVATKLELVDALLERPLEAALTLRFPPVRARRIRFWIREGKEFDYALPDWSLPELHVYRACAGPLAPSIGE